MRRTAATWTFLAAGSLVLAACAPALPVEGPGPPAAMIEVLRAASAASSAYVAGNWDEAARLYREQIAAAARDGRLAGWSDQGSYNLACVEARAGRVQEAARALAASISHGLRAPMVSDDGVTWVPGASALTLEHILADPDLDAIRDAPAYLEALRQYLDSDVPLPEGAAVVRIADAAGLTLAVVPPPVAPRGRATPPEERGWTLVDGDVRWGVARIRRAIDDLGGIPAAASIVLTATDRGASDAVWAAALEMPERIAGFTISGVTAPRAAWADRLAAVPARRNGLPAWQVTVGPGDDVLARELAAIGAVVTRSAR